ncbi:DUF1446-domain-containing protein, partial [Aureobasidium melanogenum]
MSSDGVNGSASRRAVKVANCSGAAGDPGYQMLRQATQGPVDFITGDYLAEVNLAENAEAMAAGKHEGYAETAWDGINQSAEVLAEKGIKVVLNGGALNPKGLALKIADMLKTKNIKLSVAYVEGDNLLTEVKSQVESGKLPTHLDSANSNVILHDHIDDLLKPERAIVSANAYLGARAIVKALEKGADIVICGRVADASPVIGAAWWWHGWKDTDYDQLAGALVGGHLIECSGYMTGANFAGFDEYPLESLIDLPFGICEIEDDGTVVATKHDNTKGMVNADTIKAQFLYELQGDIYLNPDVKAYLHDIRVEDVGKDRVRVTGVTGAPPPPTTKLAVFYRGGFEAQLLFNAAGYATDHKFALFKKQFEWNLKRVGVYDLFDTLEFQHIGRPAENPQTQFASTTYFRLIAQGPKQEAFGRLLLAFRDLGMQHYSGMHCSLDFRTAMPRPYLAYYPAIVKQDSIKETVTMLDASGKVAETIDAGHPSRYEDLEQRQNYETTSPIDISTLGATRTVRLGDIALGRSGDKGANINIGLFVRDPKAWDWFRSYLTKSRMQQLIGGDWKEDKFFLERVEMPHILAVHFVVYGILGRGVSSAFNLDILGKGFADYIRDKEVEVPEQVLASIEPKPTLPL